MPQGCSGVGVASVKYEVRMACNVFMYGNFVELVDTTVHPVDCACVECMSPPEKPDPRPYDSLHLKQKADPWR